MKKGFYWAKHKGEPKELFTQGLSTGWQIVEVTGYGIYECGNEWEFKEKEFEFGERVRQPVNG